MWVPAVANPEMQIDTDRWRMTIDRIVPDPVRGSGYKNCLAVNHRCCRLYMGHDWRKCGLRHHRLGRADLQAHSGTGVLCQMHGILFTGIFIDDLVTGGSGFHEGLYGAVLHLMGMRWATAFDLASQHRSSEKAEHRSRRTPSALSDGIAHRTAGNGSQCGPGAGRAEFGANRLRAADLSRHRYRLQYRRA